MARKEFCLNEDQFNRLMEACRPTPYMIIGGVMPRSPQENANEAWAVLGKELGFEPMSAQPVYGKDAHHFTAEEAS